MFRIVEFGGDDVKGNDIVIGGLQRRRRRRRWFQRQAYLRQMRDEFLIYAGLAAPAQHVGIEEIPAGAVKNAGAHLGLWFHQTLRRQRLHRLAQHGAGDAEPQGKFGIIGQQGAFRNPARDDGAAEFGDHMGVAVPAFSPAYRRFEQPQASLLWQLCRMRSGQSPV
ncbi:hypothetical protein D3C72_764570 [compost metagenome]